MRAFFVLNPGSGTVKKLGIHRGRERVAAICKANNLTATIALVPGSRISERIKDELASSQERARRHFDIVVVGGGAANALPVYRQQYVPARCVRRR